MMKMIIQIVAGVLFGLIIGIIVFIKTAPQFGARARGNDLNRILASPNYRDGKFQNLVPTPMSAENTSMFKNGLKFIKGGDNREPTTPLQTVLFDKDAFLKSDSGISYTWFGHSTVLLNLNGKIILTDPVFSENASPVSFIGAKSFKYMNQFDINQLPDLDVVLISHDHYDHLDYKTILRIKDRTKRFYVPLGVGAHLEHWGVPQVKIVEMDWWEENLFNDELVFAATPSRHFSGRAGFDKDYTLWCSWVIKCKNLSVYYSGDSGYENHFTKIGEKYGPFDFTMMECGQYNEGWPYIHMNPEQSVKAHIDLKGKIMMPVHWGKFNLSLHSWTEPIERASKEAERHNVNLISPVPGEIVNLKVECVKEKWWGEKEKLSIEL